MGIKFVISDKGKSYQVEKDNNPLIGKKIGEAVEGILGLDCTFEITGGSDKDGFRMLKDVEGIVKKKIILEKKGDRRRRTVRGNVISGDIAQVNLKVIKSEKPLEELLGKKE